MALLLVASPAEACSTISRSPCESGVSTSEHSGVSPASHANTAPSERPAILFNRWEEDWSGLADPALRTRPLDRFKYIPLGSTAGGAWLTIGGGVRERFEALDATSFGVAPARSDGWLISRSELFAQLNAGRIMAFVELESDFAVDKRVVTPVDQNRLDLEQAFASVSQPVGSGTLRLRIGRQQFAFDLQRFVAVRDGPNVRQSFDAVWSGYDVGQWQVVAFWARPVVNVDRHPFDDFSDGRNRFSGVRLERRLRPSATASIYRAVLREEAVFPDGRGSERRVVYDARYAGRNGPIDWDLEAMAQFGRVGTKRVRAWAVGWRGGYTLDLDWRPRFGFQADAASGDRRTGDDRLGTFNPLFPNGTYLTQSDLTGYANLLHLKPSIAVMPGRGLTMTAAAAAQWRWTTADAIYTQPDVPVPSTAGVGALWTGAYGQLRAD